MQYQDRAIVGEGIERAGADRGDAVHQLGVDAIFPGEGHEVVTEGVERDRHPAEAVPVSPASAFMAIVSEISGPPSIDNTASRTVTKAGKAPTTAPKPTPAVRAAASARASHHMPNAMMMTDAVMPMPGAAKVVVPK
jgi:hypothetical protein